MWPWSQSSGLDYITDKCLIRLCPNRLSHWLACAIRICCYCSTCMYAQVCKYFLWECNHGTILSPDLRVRETYMCWTTFFFFHSRVGVSASEHLLGSIDHVEEAIFVLLIPVDLGQRRRHARQALVVDDQVEGLRGCQLHSVPEGFRGRETKDVIQNVNYHCMCTSNQLRARRALMLFNDVPLRTRRALMPSRLCICVAIAVSILLVLNGTSLNSVNTLLTYNWRYTGWPRKNA